jgi:inner membrane protein
MQNLKNSVFFKIFIIAFIGLCLLIPTSMISSLIDAREATQMEAIQEVSAKWANEQTISGPFVSVPYTRYIKQEANGDIPEKIVEVKEYVHFLPSSLKISGELKPEKLHRGIYEVVVYNSKLQVSGEFRGIKLSGQEVPLKDMQVDRAFISLGISDLRGIEQQISLQWNQENAAFNSGTVTSDLLGSGINVPVKLQSNDSSTYTFSLTLDLKGSQRIYFTPVAEVTDVEISSPWNNPSFNGAFLPDTRDITPEGFKASWNILHLNRNYPQMWYGSAHQVGSSAFGIDLLLPVDNYQKSTRSIKYAILFIGFTFLTFFFVEVLNKVFIHPIQYILVGIALVVFYTLLLSFSEHIPFNMAFSLAAGATLLLVAGYVKAILKSWPLTGLLIGLLLVLYTFIFVIIQLQDYALLIGSIGIFIILALVMYFSRKIDWYNIKLGEEETPQA